MFCGCPIAVAVAVAPVGWWPMRYLLCLDVIVVNRYGGLPAQGHRRSSVPIQPGKVTISATRWL